MMSNEKKHVVYWGAGNGRMYLAFNAEDPAREFYEGIKQKDPTAELLEQTEAEVTASGVWSLDALMSGQGSVGIGKRNVGPVLDSMKDGIHEAEDQAEKHRKSE